MLVPNDSLAEVHRLKAREERDTALMIAYIDSAILFKPFDIWARNWRVDVFRGLGRNDSAYLEMKRVLEHCHSKEDSVTMLGNYLWDLAWMPHAEEHGQWVSEYVRLTADSSRVYSYLARAATRDPGRMNEAVGYLRHAVRSSSGRDMEVHQSNLFYYLLSERDTTEACVEYCNMELANRTHIAASLVAICKCPTEARLLTK